MTDAQKAAALERLVAALLGPFHVEHEAAMMVARLKSAHGPEWVAALVLEYRRRDDE